MDTPDFDDELTRPAELEELDGYQRIQDFINDNWGTLRLKDYLDSLLADTNNHTRQGFPSDAGAALLKLSLANTQVLENKGYNFDEDSASQFTTSNWTLPKNF